LSETKLEGYLINLDLTYEQVDESTWIINDEEKGLEQVVVAYAEPLVIIRVKVMNVPKKDSMDFLENCLN
jgi:hypothetical protein